MPYIWVALLTVGFASGYGLSSALSHAEIQQMSDGIAAQNLEAKLTLQILTEQADNANKQLEDANDSAIKAINSQRDDFKSKRMYDTHRKSNNCTATNTASITDSSFTDGQLSTELTEFLKSEAYRADEISNYATLCNQFIKGIAHGAP